MGNDSAVNFTKWYEDLRMHMSSINGYDGLPMCPDEWLCKEGWVNYFVAGLDPVSAFLEER